MIGQSELDCPIFPENKQNRYCKLSESDIKELKFSLSASILCPAIRAQKRKR